MLDLNQIFSEDRSANEAYNFLRQKRTWIAALLHTPNFLHRNGTKPNFLKMPTTFQPPFLKYQLFYLHKQARQEQHIKKLKNSLQDLFCVGIITLLLGYLAHQSLVLSTQQHGPLHTIHADTLQNVTVPTQNKC